MTCIMYHILLYIYHKSMTAVMYQPYGHMSNSEYMIEVIGYTHMRIYIRSFL